MNATRLYITKSKAGHYTATVRDAAGVLVSIQDKLPTLQAAREYGKAAQIAHAAKLPTNA